MLVRGALARLVADAPTTSAHDLPQLARSLQRSLLARNALKLPATRVISRACKAVSADARRSYATTTRATKPAEAGKKAVNAKATEKAAPKQKATTAKGKATTKTTTKAAAKPTKKKPAAKKPVKKAAKKAPAKKRVKKEPTPEELQAAKIRQLKKLALKEPVTSSTLQGRHVFISEALSGTTDVAKGLAEASSKWSTLTPAEMEVSLLMCTKVIWPKTTNVIQKHYNHLAGEKTAARKAEYLAWVQSHTVDEIRIANNARSQLRKLLPPNKSGSHAHTSKIQDDRQAKRPRNPYVFYFTERMASGDFRGISTTEAATLIGSQWKALSDSEKSVCICLVLC